MHLHIHQFTMFINNEMTADDADGFHAERRFLAPRSVLFCNLVVWVAEENERQVVLGSKFLVRFCTIGTDADHKTVLFLNRDVTVAKAIGLDRSARCIIFGIKVDDDFFAAKIGQFYVLAVFIGQGKIGREIADLYFGGHVLCPHFYFALAFAAFSFTRNFTMRVMSFSGNGLSSGNCTEPFPCL